MKEPACSLRAVAFRVTPAGLSLDITTLGALWETGQRCLLRGWGLSSPQKPCPGPDGLAAGCREPGPSQERDLPAGTCV